MNIVILGSGVIGVTTAWYLVQFTGTQQAVRHAFLLQNRNVIGGVIQLFLCAEQLQCAALTPMTAVIRQSRCKSTGQ